MHMRYAEQAKQGTGAKEGRKVMKRKEGGQAGEGRAVFIEVGKAVG
jgi:hypothetical protein